MYDDTVAVAGVGFLGALCLIFGNDQFVQIVGGLLLAVAVLAGPFLVRRESRRRRP